MNYISVDTETTGLNSFKNDRPFAIGIAFPDKTTKYIQWNVTKNREIEFVPPAYDWYDDWVEINSLIGDPKIAKVFAHAKFDIHMLNSIGIEVKGKIHDVLLMAKVVNNLEQEVAAKPLSKKYCNIPDDDERTLRAKTVRARHAAKDIGYKISDDVAADYWLVKQIFDDNACEDYCRRDNIRNILLYQFYSQALTEFNLWHIYERELKLLHIVQKMEKRGMFLHTEQCRLKVFSLMVDINNIACSFNAEYGEINLNSAQQKAKLLVEKCGVPLTEKTDKGQYKTGVNELRPFKSFPVVDQLLKRAGYETGRKYLVNYLNNVDKDNFLHATINQFVTDTFRFSCENPNLQNVPNPFTSSGEYVVDGREHFGPRPGYVWYVIDYSQLELRLKVSGCGKGALLQAFLDGRDPHNETRQKVPFLAAKEPGVGRKLAKNTNFTLINVGGPGVLNEKYNIPLDEAKEIHDGFHLAYPEIKEHSNKLASEAKARGYIYNAFNRKLFIRERIEKYGRWIAGWYQATAFWVQSSAADLIKIAMIKLAEKFEKEKLDCHLLLQIHDELIIEVHEQYWDDKVLMRAIKAIMENHYGAFLLATPVEFKRTKTHWNDKEVVEL